MKIRVEPSAIDEKRAKFILPEVIHPGGPYAFESADDAVRSPLPWALWQLGGIHTILVADETLSICLEAPGNWRELAPQIAQTIRETMAGEGPLIVPPPEPEPDPELGARVAEIIKTKVNPLVAGHGGDIALIKVVDKQAHVAMGGGCQGCGAAALTLKLQVERILKEEFPEITKVVDATDHNAGEKPYYDSLPSTGVYTDPA